MSGNDRWRLRGETRWLGENEGEKAILSRVGVFFAGLRSETRGIYVERQNCGLGGLRFGNDDDAFRTGVSIVLCPIQLIIVLDEGSTRV